MKEKTKLTRDYVRRSMKLFRETREEAKQLLEEVENRGYKQVHINGDNELAEVCKLTCIEEGFEIVDRQKEQADEISVLDIDSHKLS